MLETIANRRSHRAYKPARLPEDVLEKILRAGLQSPSARNLQPWHFSVCQDPALLRDVNDAAGKMMNREGADIFYGAPTAVFLFGDPANPWAPIDCGIAVENLALAAESLGVGSVILGLPKLAFGGEKADELKKRLACPDGYEFMIAVALGYATDTKDAHKENPEKITRIRAK